mmetsp:Transcript_6548/g.18887  ORF Transcript_6548/g.18887 Transcript_6548/m.18887 type:complete len:249 (+) Transcript_6548:313-1059(+)
MDLGGLTMPSNEAKADSQHLPCSPLLDLPDHVWDLIWARLDDKGSRLALCLTSARFYRLWADAMLSCIHGAEITLPVGRFVTSCTKKSVQHHSLQDHRVTFLMQDCDWKWLSLLDTFLKHASGGSTSWSPIMQQYPVPFAVLNGRQRPPPIQLTCPPGFVSAAEIQSGGEGSCAGHLPTSCDAKDSRQICVLLSPWDMSRNDFFFRPADVRLQLFGNAQRGTAAACLQLRAVRPVMQPQLVPTTPNFV